MAKRDLELSALVPEACTSLRAGAKLDVRPQPDGTANCTSGDQQVGKLTVEQLAGTPQPCVGVVRSVRQQDGKAIKVLVRITPGAPPQAAQGTDSQRIQSTVLPLAPRRS